MTKTLLTLTAVALLAACQTAKPGLFYCPIDGSWLRTDPPAAGEIDPQMVAPADTATTHYKVIRWVCDYCGTDYYQTNGWPK